ncbi:hypothetical protein MRX96_036680 [Rhipicephalus microplus]
MLGMAWSKETDHFIYNSENNLTCLKKKKDTNSFVLRTVFRIHDPLGFLAPYVVRWKMQFQQLWTDKVDWDEDLSSHFATKMA